MTESPRNTQAKPTRWGLGGHPLRGPQDPQVHETLWFDVIGDPKGEPRPVAVALGPKRAKMVVPDVARPWKHDVRTHAIAARARAPGWETLAPPGVAFLVYLAFRLHRPKSHFRTGRFSGMLKPKAPQHHTQTPDKDNLEKAVLDALTRFEGLPPVFWCDDAQVVDGRTSKRWTHPGEEPGVAIGLVKL